MNLKFNFIENTINITDDSINSIEVENKCYFYRIISVLNNISKGDISENLYVYDNNDNEININNKICVLIDYFNIDFNNKKIINSLYKLSKEKLSEQDRIKLSDLYNKMKSIINKSVLDFDFKISFNDNFDIENLLKILRISISNKENLIDNLLLLIDIEKTFKLDELLVFVNLKQYLNKDELIELYKYSIYNNVKILLIDLQNFGVTLENEKKLIIDSNLDEFVL